jgi:hypothetical protein
VAAAREQDLVDLYISGGGMAGVLKTLKASSHSASTVTVGPEVTDYTRTGLSGGDLAMARPGWRVGLVKAGGNGVEVHTPENI